MLIADTVPRASHFHNYSQSMNQLQDVKPMVHLWKSSCCPTYKAVMVTEARTGCTFLTHGAPYTQKLTAATTAKYLEEDISKIFSLLKKVIPCLNFCNYCWCLSYGV